MELKNILDHDKFETLLVANWTEFINSSKLLAFVLTTVTTNTNRLAVISSANIKSKGVTITLSRFYWTSSGFDLWVEFQIPISANKMAEGTMELNLSNEGNISYVNMSGNLYCV